MFGSFFRTAHSIRWWQRQSLSTHRLVVVATSLPEPSLELVEMLEVFRATGDPLVCSDVLQTHKGQPINGVCCIDQQIDVGMSVGPRSPDGDAPVKETAHSDSVLG